MREAVTVKKEKEPKEMVGKEDFVQPKKKVRGFQQKVEGRTRLLTGQQFLMIQFADKNP